MMDLPSPLGARNLAVTRSRDQVVAEFERAGLRYRLTLPLHADGSGFIFAAADRQGPELRRRAPRSWQVCRVHWTSPESIAAFAAWCGAVDDDDLAEPVDQRPAPQRVDPRVDLRDFLPVSQVGRSISGVIRRGRAVALTQRGFVVAVVVPVELWQSVIDERGKK